MKNIINKDYEIVGRRRIKLADGKWGWIGILRQAYMPDRFVVGCGQAFGFILSTAPLTFDEAKEAAKTLASYEIM